MYHSAKKAKILHALLILSSLNWIRIYCHKIHNVLKIERKNSDCIAKKLPTFFFKNYLKPFLIKRITYEPIQQKPINNPFFAIKANVIK